MLNQIEAVTTVTAQHREMLDQVLEIFKIKPDYDLNIMHQGQSLNDITVDVLNKLKGVIENGKARHCIGSWRYNDDICSKFSGFLSTSCSRPYVEAGLRTWNKYSPYPEENEPANDG